jgi:adenosylhomocysteine nucleosidase
MIAVTYAMPEEKPRCSLPDSAVLVRTGIGKTLAVSRVAALLRDHPIDMIVSVGFCGGLNGTPQEAMVLATDTRQWDLYLNDLDIPLGHGYAMHAPLALPRVDLDTVPSPVRGRLISGDRFVDRTVHVSPDAVAVDMETAALAMLAAELEIPLVSIREVSDIADGPQDLTHQQFLDTIRIKGPAYSEAVEEMVVRGPEGIPSPRKL